MAIGASPRRVLFSSHLELIVVGCSDVSLARSSRRRLLDASRIQKKQRPLLKFVDPDEQVYPPNGVMNSEFYMVDTSVVEEREAKSSFGRTGERIYSLIDWFCTENDRTYHFLVLGMGLNKPSQDSCRAGDGRVVFLSISKSGDGTVRVKQKFALTADRPVIAVAGYGRSTLVFSTGCDVHLRTLAGKKFTRAARFTLNSPCVRLSVHEPYIYATTMRDSLQVLKYENDRVTRVFNDECARVGQAHLLLPGSSILMVADRDMCVAGLWQPSRAQKKSSLQTLFEVELPMAITQLRAVSLQRVWERNSDVPGIMTLNEGSTRQIQIIGSTLYGSFHHFTLLSGPAWCLLRFIQNLARRDVEICPYRESGIYLAPLEPDATMARSKHVDGDLLQGLLVLGAEKLRQLLEADPTEQPDGQFVADFSSASARLERFREIAGDLFGESLEDPVDLAMNYLNRLLQPLF
ncbi:MAG: hypothetical protein M1825_004484 [Sarcosagium campestre]|nr:MAG: hypothetical protein M1825_004484 [Sarcosagium campestre]